VTRSIKKRPFGSFYTATSDRKDKVRVHRRERRTVRQLLHLDLEHGLLPSSKAFGDGEDFSKGKKVFVPALGWDLSLREVLRWFRK
jgi:hypothetical protein